MNLKDISEVLRSAKHRRLSKIYCPKCASPNIGLAPNYYYMVGPRYICKSCGYIGPLVMELEKEKES